MATQALTDMSISLANAGTAKQFGSTNAIVPGGGNVNPFAPQAPTPNTNTGEAGGNLNTSPYKDSSGNPIVVGNAALNPQLTGTTGTPINGAPKGNTTTPPGGTSTAQNPQTTGTQQTTPQTVTQMMNTPPNDISHLNQYGSGGSANSPATVQSVADKYKELYDKVQAYATPNNGGEARSQINQLAEENKTQPTTDPVTQSMDAYLSMNPVIKGMFDQIQELFSSQNTRQSLADKFSQMEPDPGVATLSKDQMNLMDINNLMKGQDDAVRAEITKAGGFATEQQVRGLVAARNKVLMDQASKLQDTINMKEDYVKQIMTLTQTDYAEADKQVSDQLGLDEKVADMLINMDQAATGNYFKQLQLQQTQDASQVAQYDKNITNLGGDYTAFASTIPDSLKGKVESLMGLAPGTLSNPNELAYLTASSMKQQQLAQSGQKIQIQLNNSDSLQTYRDALTQLAGARTLAANANVVNSTIKSMFGAGVTTNPILQYRNAAVWIANVGTAYAKAIDPTNMTKGPADLELIDAAVKTNNGGQQVTQVQVDALMQSLGWKGHIDVVGGKIQNISGLIDNNTRTAIRDLATSNLIQKRLGANQAIEQLNSRLGQTGAPSNYDMASVQAEMVPQGYTEYATANDGSTVYQMPDGTIVNGFGQLYDSNGDPIN